MSDQDRAFFWALPVSVAISALKWWVVLTLLTAWSHAG